MDFYKALIVKKGVNFFGNSNGSRPNLEMEMPRLWIKA
jgi:hypothetical protein